MMVNYVTHVMCAKIKFMSTFSLYSENLQRPIDILNFNPSYLILSLNLLLWLPFLVGDRMLAPNRKWTFISDGQMTFVVDVHRTSPGLELDFFSTFELDV